MKVIIITLLLSYIFCAEMVLQKDYNLVSFADGKNEYLNVDVSKYKQNDVVHICVFVVSGTMDKAVHYGFYDEKPGQSTSLNLPYLGGTSYSESYCIGDDYDSECGHKYYYDIKVLVEAKYMIIEITGYNGSDFYYTIMSIGAYTYFIIYGVIILACIIGCVIFYRCKVAKAKKTSSSSVETLTPLNPPDDTPYSSADISGRNNDFETKPNTN